MNRFYKIIMGAILLLGMITLFKASFAQEGVFSIHWFTIDNGGGTSLKAESGYSLSGTIGQPDIQLMTGVSYQLSGGFWNGSSLAGSPSDSGENINFLPIIFKPSTEEH